MKVARLSLNLLTLLLITAVHVYFSKQCELLSPTRLACGILTVHEGYRSVPVERALPPSPRTGSPKDLGTKILVPIVNLVVNILSSKRLDAKKHYVISAKALDGIWPGGHACAVPWLR